MPTTTAPRRARASKSTLPSQTATGATTKGATVAEVICPAAPRRNPGGTTQAHQTHGAVTPLSGSITSVNQLINGGRSIAKGASASFSSLSSYTAHLKTLSLHELRRHALEDARIVPIDDRERLIRRLETQWTTTAARQTGRTSAPARVPFTQEQLDAQQAIKNQLLRQ